MTKPLTWNLNPFSHTNIHSKPSTDSILEESWSNTLLAQRILIGKPIAFEEESKNEHTLAVIDYCGMVIPSLASYYIMPMIGSFCDGLNPAILYIPFVMLFLAAAVVISCWALILDIAVRLAMTTVVIAAFPIIAAITWGLKTLSNINIERDTPTGEESIIVTSQTDASSESQNISFGHEDANYASFRR